MTRSRRALWLAVPAALFLAALFLPAVDQATERFTTDARPPLELLPLLAALALVGARLGIWGRALLAAAIVLAATVNAADALVPSLLGRPLDLYWDLRHVQSLFGLAVEAGGAGWLAGLGAAAAVGLLAAGYATERALAILAAALGGRRLAGLGLAALALVAVPFAIGEAPRLRTPALDAVAAQSRSFVRAAQIAASGGPAALPAPPHGHGLAGLKRRDVYLVFIESYGTVAFDEPEFAATLRPAMDGFAGRVAAAGYQIVTGRLTSPTYGGGSWFAHSTLASGIKIGDQFLYRQLREGAPRGIAHDFRAAGYRTVVAMPGLKKPEPGATEFWGFDAAYYAAQFGYDGPPFGWFDIPDQYTLRTLSEREQAERTRTGKPLFAQIVLVSSHTPFAPLPPYVADWNDVGRYASISQERWREIYASPDWSHLDRPYLASLAYDFRVLGDWIADRVGDGALVILLGDHQPPAFIAGARQPWTVPIHVLSRDPDLLRPFAARGYAEGMAPPPEARGMESFLGDFLAGYGTPPALAAEK